MPGVCDTRAENDKIQGGGWGGVEESAKIQRWENFYSARTWNVRDIVEFPQNVNFDVLYTLVIQVFKMSLWSLKFDIVCHFGHCR